MDCAEAANGREGMERLAEGGADIVTTDWNMPEISGIEFIRANVATRDLPVMMVTINAAKADIVDA